MAETNPLLELADFFKNYLSDKALKKKVYGTETPTTEQMQDKAFEMAERFFPEQEATAVTPSTPQKEVSVTKEEVELKKRMREEARKRRVMDLMRRLREGDY